MKHLDALRGKTLLVVEDEDDLREPLAMEFQSLGCKVFEARNGVEGFTIVCEEHIDVVVSDIRMPGGDGIEMLKKIKDRDQGVPVVMLITGFSDVSREEAYDLGAEAILAKPFDLNEIEEAVERLVQPLTSRLSNPPEQGIARKEIAHTFPSLELARDQGAFALGRGGFFLGKGDAELSAARGARVSFAIKFERGDVLVIEGTGITRWVRSQDAHGYQPGVGIEFETLSEGSRKEIISLLTRFRAFLPRAALGEVTRANQGVE